MLIIFDFDGVLFPAIWDKPFKAYVAVLKSIGKDYRDFFGDIPEFKKSWNPDWRENNQKLGIKDSVDTNRIFYETYNYGLQIFPWAENAILNLSSRHELAMLTSRNRQEIEKLIGSLAIYFWPLVSSDSVVKLKPDPEGVNLILSKTKVLKEQVLIIGDLTVDILAGKAAGIKTGAVKWGLGGDDEEGWKAILDLNPDYLFEKPEDLLRL